MGSKTIDIRGKKFGRLTPTEKVPPVKGRSMWKCLCDCGNTTVVRAEHIRSGRSTSCGCFSLESHTKHGMARTPEYRAWQHLRDRCDNPNNAAYQDYGGRGIRVCKEWCESFEAFISDMGARPSSRHSIDRIDNDGDYTPGNCRWATQRMQQSNKRNTLKATIAGVTKTVKQWCEELRIVSYPVALKRIKRGVPADLAVTVKGHGLRNM